MAKKENKNKEENNEPIIIISKDLLWKSIIENLCTEFLMYFFDWAENEIDFSKGYEFLDSELDKIYTNTKKDVKNADKLIKIFLKNGEEKYILMHVEVQGYEDKEFAKRMFWSFYRIFDTHQTELTAFALFTDDKPDYKPDTYVYEYKETRLIYQYKTFKIIEHSLEDLYKPKNIFSFVMLAVKNALEKDTKTDLAQLKWKKELVQMLINEGYSDNHIQCVLYFIRSYISIKNKEINKQLDSEIKTITKQHTNMGIEEMIKQESFRQGQEIGEEIGIAKEKEVRISKALSKGMKIHEVAELFDVTIEYVKKISEKK